MKRTARVYSTPQHRLKLPPHLVGWSYIVLLAAAEAVAAWAGLIPGLLAHGTLLLVILGHYLLASAAAEPYQRSLPVLALLPLLRITALALPLQGLPPLWWPAALGLPLLITLGLTARTLNLPRTALLGTRGDWRWQLIIASSGLPLASLSYWLLTPPALAPLSTANLILGGLIILFGSALLEEMLLRGAIQTVFADLVGRWRWIASALLWTALYLGTRSAPWLLMLSLIGLGAGWLVLRTGALWGSILAHTIWKLGLILLWPGLSQAALADRRTALVWGLWSFWLILGASLALWLFNRLRADRHAASSLLTQYHVAIPPNPSDTPAEKVHQP